MDKLHMHIEQDEETGELTLKFIDWTDTTYGNRGYWTERKFSEGQLKELLRMCYPKWDGEHQISECCTDDYDGEDSDKDVMMKGNWCATCPHKECRHHPGDMFENLLQRYLAEKEKTL